MTVKRSPAALDLAYRVEGDLSRLRIPEPAGPRAGKDLWKHTCCEAFVRETGAEAYREFNFSPSGEWAVFDFARYRDGAASADERTDPGVSVNRSVDTLVLNARATIPTNKALAIALSCVIEDEYGVLSYWALRHPPGKPDFHHRDCFALELDEVRH